MKNENCVLNCLCRSCANPDCERDNCAVCALLPDFSFTACSTYETQGHYYYDDIGNEYWIGKDNRRHYTRDEG